LALIGIGMAGLLFWDKTHRGLAGCVTRGLSAGGRIFGYRAVAVEAARRGTKHTAPARFEIHPEEAAIVQRIFRDYAAGHSMQAIAFALNREGVHFPAHETQRGPHRRGWAVSTNSRDPESWSEQLSKPRDSSPAMSETGESGPAIPGSTYVRRSRGAGGARLEAERTRGTPRTATAP